MRVNSCTACDSVIVSYGRHGPRCGLSFTQLYALPRVPQQPLELTRTEQSAALEFLASRPSGTTRVESVLLHWDGGYWRPHLGPLLYESSFDATISLDVSNLAAVDVAGHPPRAVAMLRALEILSEVEDYADDLEADDFSVLEAVLKDLSPGDETSSPAAPPEDLWEDEEWEEDDPEDSLRDVSILDIKGSSVPEDHPDVPRDAVLTEWLLASPEQERWSGWGALHRSDWETVSPSDLWDGQHRHIPGTHGQSKYPDPVNCTICWEVADLIVQIHQIRQRRSNAHLQRWSRSNHV